MKKVYYTWQQVEGACLDIARQMSNHNWRPDYIVGIGRGGLVPANLLSQYTDIKMCSLDISLRDGGDTVSNCGMSADAFEGKKILIVDDINDQGSTVNWIKKDWESSALPGHPNWESIWGDSVRFAVLTHNQSSTFKDPDYYVWTVNKAEEDCWLVYPWEEFWL